MARRLADWNNDQFSKVERLKIASLLLTYPNQDFQRMLEDVEHICREANDHLASAAVDALLRLSQSDLLRCYVATFDMQESTALYLTSHELGDSRERGGALLRLHALLRSAALEPLHGELPDYIPLLLEFLAEKPIGMPTAEVESRLSGVCHGIYERLEQEHPYRPLFALIQACLQVDGTPMNASQLDSTRTVETDVDNLPYPLVYD